MNKQTSLYQALSRDERSKKVFKDGRNHIVRKIMTTLQKQIQYFRACLQDPGSLSSAAESKQFYHPWTSWRNLCFLAPTVSEGQEEPMSSAQHKVHILKQDFGSREEKNGLKGICCFLSAYSLLVWVTWKLSCFSVNFNCLEKAT